MAKRTADGDNFDDILRFLAGLGTIAGIVLTIRRLLRSSSKA